MPKQIISLFGQKTLLQQTYARIRTGFKAADIFISTNKNQQPLIKKQLPEVKDKNFIIEPMAKNTAAAIGLACVKISGFNPKETIAIVNSDQFIKEEKAMIKALKAAGQMVKTYPDYVTLIGIKPAYPETGYGYIQLGSKFRGGKVFQVKSFTEKPDLKTAKKYVSSKNYLWNPAYFVFQVDTMLELFKKHLPGQYKILKSIQSSPDKTNALFKKIKPISVDYGIMEKTKTE